MQLQHIFDQDGIWYTNTGAYPFVDPTNGCRFEPRVRTKAPKTEWLDMQAAIIKPEAEEQKTAPAKAPVTAPAKAEPAKAEPAKAEPAKAEPAKA